MQTNTWLVKQEPTAYAWAAFVKENGTAWTGVRNFQARNYLRQMQVGDWVFFYHSGEEKQVVGLAEVARAAYPDPTAKEGDWSAVDLKPLRPCKTPVSLAQIKADPVLKEMLLARNSRLSVSPVTVQQRRRLLARAGGRSLNPSQAISLYRFISTVALARCGDH